MKIFIKSIIVIIALLNSKSIISQNYEAIYSQIDASTKIIDKKIINSDTIYILEKRAGCKYVDSLKLKKLSKKIYYFFHLPDSLKDGKYAIYYSDKKKNLAFIVTYKNYKRNGAYNYYYYDKTIRESGFYADNCLDKVRIKYNEKGQTQGIFYYDNCNLNGSCYTFYNTGEFSTMMNYKNGKKNGVMIIYGYDKMGGFPEIRSNYEFIEDQRVDKKP